MSTDTDNRSTIFNSQMELYFENLLSPCILESYYLRYDIFENFSEFIKNPAKSVSPSISDTFKEF